MSDFPPFRSAPAKGSVTGRVTSSKPSFEEVMKEPQLVETDPSVPDHPSVQHVTVCAKCGSREVREAVLIGDEVYVKL